MNLVFLTGFDMNVQILAGENNMFMAALDDKGALMGEYDREHDVVIEHWRRRWVDAALAATLKDAIKKFVKDNAL